MISTGVRWHIWIVDVATQDAARATRAFYSIVLLLQHENKIHHSLLSVLVTVKLFSGKYWTMLGPSVQLTSWRLLSLLADAGWGLFASKRSFHDGKNNGKGQNVTATNVGVILSCWSAFLIGSGHQISPNQWDIDSILSIDQWEVGRARYSSIDGELTSSWSNHTFLWRD